MKIPKILKVGGIIYTIEIVEKIDGAAAMIHFDEEKIRVQKAKEDFMNQAFWHEIFHAINGELRETDVEFLAVSLYQIITDNPELFEKSKKNTS